MLADILPFAHSLLRTHIREGDCVMDGTAGNGHDTLLLAQCVGETGCVFAFDIQTTAIEATRARLAEHGLLSRVTLIQDGHQHAAQYIRHPLRTAMFNFGYLPHGDKNITTLPETSVAAVQAALDLLDKGGYLVVVVYHGHEAGKAEKAALLNYFAALPARRFSVLRYGHVNRLNAAPFAVAVEKKFALQTMKIDGKPNE